MKPVSSSFRDPSGYVFMHDRTVYRFVSKKYQKQYDHLMKGLYQQATKSGLLISHQEIADQSLCEPTEDLYKVLQPKQIPFISYPYEWCFGQYKAAALTTLRLHRLALNYGMMLKDASAYNIQFLNEKAILIDTLSFELYQEGMIWPAYGQFCRHFLAPLMLSVYTDVRMSQLMRVYIDGVPLDLASKLLHHKGGFAVRQHIHWHARAVMNNANVDERSAQKKRTFHMSKYQHCAMIDSLIRIVEGLELKGISTEWGDYYEHTNYDNTAATQKEKLVLEMLETVKPNTVWDFGANNGHYTRLATRNGAFAVAFDIDPIAVEKNYNEIVCNKEKAMLPLMLDLTNPSPAIGFANEERLNIAERMKPDCILALAVIHHMAISNNIPLASIAKWFATMSPFCIVEFVPKADSQVKRLLTTRDDIFTQYHREGFEAAFQKYFDLIRADKIVSSERILYLFRSKVIADEE